MLYEVITTVMYMGNHSDATKKSLLAQREIVDQELTKRAANLSAADTEQLAGIDQALANVRSAVDADKAEFDAVYAKAYGTMLGTIRELMGTITQLSDDQTLSASASAYYSLVQAQFYTASERDFISFILARSTALETTELNRWLSLIGRADAFNYDTAIDAEVKST